MWGACGPQEPRLPLGAPARRWCAGLYLPRPQDHCAPPPVAPRRRATSSLHVVRRSIRSRPRVVRPAERLTASTSVRCAARSRYRPPRRISPASADGLRRPAASRPSAAARVGKEIPSAWRSPGSRAARLSRPLKGATWSARLAHEADIRHQPLDPEVSVMVLALPGCGGRGRNNHSLRPRRSRTRAGSPARKRAPLDRAAQVLEAQPQPLALPTTRPAMPCKPLESRPMRSFALPSPRLEAPAAEGRTASRTGLLRTARRASNRTGRSGQLVVEPTTPPGSLAGFAP
jgi:hypothetical protein